jgi:hypothetical protein
MNRSRLFVRIASLGEARADGAFAIVVFSLVVVTAFAIHALW